MRIPALASDGHTYEFEALQRLAARAAEAAELQAVSLGVDGDDSFDVMLVSPMTRERLRREVTYNRALLETEGGRAAAVLDVVRTVTTTEAAWDAQLAIAKAEAQAARSALAEAQAELVALRLDHRRRGDETMGVEGDEEEAPQEQGSCVVEARRHQTLLRRPLRLRRPSPSSSRPREMHHPTSAHLRRRERRERFATGAEAAAADPATLEAAAVDVGDHHGEETEECPASGCS